MLKIEDDKKEIELNGEKVELKTLSAKKQVEFAVKIEKEKSPMKQVEMMIGHIVDLGVKKAVAEKISMKGLQKIIEHSGDNGKK